MIESTFELEKELIGNGYELVIGVDEAGRGPLAGPVVAAAALLKSGELEIPDGLEKNFRLVRDSKTLSEKQRSKAFDLIHENFYVGVGMCDHLTIDRINILEASFLAMKKAVGELLHKIGPLLGSRTIILIDGNKPIHDFSHEQRAVVNGDKRVKSISAASIIAKVTRDRLMLEMHAKYPLYGFDKHKGYGTRFHMEMIEKYGPSEIHRMSFEPLSTLAKREK